MFSPEILLGAGWYPEENDGIHAFRWMKKEANFFIEDYQVPGKKYLLITAAGHADPEEQHAILELYINGQKKGEKEIDGSFCSYAFPFEETGNIQFDFALNKTFSVHGDGRQLGIMLRRMESIKASEASIFLEGWYGWEFDDLFPFRWMKKKAKFNLSAEYERKHKYISFYIFSEFHDFSQKLNISLHDRALSEITLLPKWNFYSFPLQLAPSVKKEQMNPESEMAPDRPGTDELNLCLNRVLPEEYHQGDGRQLGIRVSHPEFHDQDETHRLFMFFRKNALLNYQEMREGKTKLASFPLNLGVDLYGKCNINPHCVYCLWERMKELEGEYAEVNVDERTLEGYGHFFQSARLVINCSFGEPLLHLRFKEILEFCQEQKKILEISTNGQSFTPRTVQALLGKPVYLYVSLDAACKDTYAKIRNERWDSIIPHLKLLSQERKKKGNLPKIYMVFMPMRVNLGDLEAYFQLCQKIEADSLVLRPLNYLENPQIEADRGGYHFDYEKELLSSQELEEVFRKCDEYSKKYGVPVANQFTFGKAEDLVSNGTSSLPPEKQRF